MPETELDAGLDPTNHFSWWKRLLIGALVGGFFGALNIWFYEFSLIRLIAAILGGATFFAMLGLLAGKFANNKLKLTALAGLAGFVAGAVYWLIARPSSSPFLAVGLGLLGGIAFACAESKR